MKTKFTPGLTLILACLFSGIISYTFAVQVTADSLNNTRKFQVVDIQQLSRHMMENLEETIRNSDVQMDPEMIAVLGENEARKLFRTIANTGGEHDIILPKSSVIHAPSQYEITEDIALQLGLMGVENKDIRKMLNADD